MLIVLPWPPKELSPNARKHWRAKNPVKVIYRDQCCLIGLKHSLKSDGRNVPVSIMFYPARNAGDLDNMLSSIKSGIDGLAIGLGINDKLFRPIIIDMAKADKMNPRVELTLDIAPV